MANALARAGIQHTYIELVGSGHGFDGANPAPTSERVLEQLELWLG